MSGVLVLVLVLAMLVLYMVIVVVIGRVVSVGSIVRVSVGKHVRC
jgi:hypothetical protein